MDFLNLIAECKNKKMFSVRAETLVKFEWPRPLAALTWSCKITLLLLHCLIGFGAKKRTCSKVRSLVYDF